MVIVGCGPGTGMRRLAWKLLERGRLGMRMWITTKEGYLAYCCAKKCLEFGQFLMEGKLSFPRNWLIPRTKNYFIIKNPHPKFCGFTHNFDTKGSEDPVQDLETEQLPQQFPRSLSVQLDSQRSFISVNTLQHFINVGTGMWCILFPETMMPVLMQSCQPAQLQR